MQSQPKIFSFLNTKNILLKIRGNLGGFWDASFLLAHMSLMTSLVEICL